MDLVEVSVSSPTWINCKEYRVIHVSWTWTHGLGLMNSDSWIVPKWSLKTKEVFRIGLGDRPAWSLKNTEVFRIRLKDHPHVDP